MSSHAILFLGFAVWTCVFSLLLFFRPAQEARAWEKWCRSFIGVLLLLLPIVVILHLRRFIVFSELESGVESPLEIWEAVVFPMYVFALAMHVYLNRHYYGRLR